MSPRVSALGAFAFAPLMMVARADAEPPDWDAIPIRHPLVSASAVAAVAERPGEPIDAVLRDLVVFDEWTEEGLVSGVRWVEREADPEAVPATEPVRAFWVDPQIEAWLENGDGVMDVNIAYLREAWDESVSVMHQQALAMLAGEATTVGDLRRIRLEVAAGRAETGAVVLQPTIDDIIDAGDEVVEWSPVAGTVRAVVHRGTLAPLLLDPLLRRVEVHQEDETDNAGYATSITGAGLTGIETSDLLQAEPLYYLAYEGNPDEHVMITEGEADLIMNDHLSFLDVYDGNRMLVCEDNNHAECNYIDVTNGDSHATQVASVIGSDLTRGQDPDCVSTGSCTSTAQRERSGVARTATMVGVDGGVLARLVERVLDDPDVYLLNKSSSGDEDPTCNGTCTQCQAFNSLYEDGVAIFNSNGNDGHEDEDDCTVGDPASAIGVMAVGAYQVNGSTHEEEAYSGNSRGGTAEEGGGRTIIGLLAPTKHDYRAVEDWNDSPYYETGSFTASSGATPAVTGAAAVFRDYYVTTHSSLIDDPGILYTFLQLMGDREDEDGTHMVHHFDPVTGAGKLRLRMFDTNGLDDPKGWSAGSECIQHGASYPVEINGGSTLHADVDYIKAVIWWYDRGHEVGCTPDNTVCHDKFDLSLQSLVGLSTWTTQRSSNTADNRQRVYLSGVGGDEYRLRITGDNVTSDGEGCGSNANRVYYAWMYEENDRDDGGTLTTYVRPEP